MHSFLNHGWKQEKCEKSAVKSEGNTCIESSQKDSNPKAKNRESDRENSDSMGSPCAECDSHIYENDVALQCDLCDNQLMQLCTARTAWSESDQPVWAVHSCNSW